MKKTPPRLIIIKVLKTTDKMNVVKVPREKTHITYKGIKIKIKQISHWKQLKRQLNIFEVLKEKHNAEFYIQQNSF